MNDFPERRRKPSKRVRVCTEEKMEKIVHREVERQRRQDMASLYASLRSLLPLEFIQGKRSMSDQVNEAVNYIKYLQGNIKEMSSKRDDLMLLSGRSFESSNEQGWNEISNRVVIRPCLVGVEIVFSVLQTPFSSVLQVLRRHGLCVVSCSSSNVNDRLIHTLQAELYEQMVEMILSFSLSKPKDFKMSVLVAYTRPSSLSEIVKVNLLASRDSTEEQSHGLRSYPSNSMGG